MAPDHFVKYTILWFWLWFFVFEILVPEEGLKQNFFQDPADQVVGLNNNCEIGEYCAIQIKFTFSLTFFFFNLKIFEWKY